MNIDWTSSFTLGVEIAIAIAISAAAYYFINWPTAAVLIIVLCSASLIVWNSLQYVSVDKKEIKPKKNVPAVWLTKFRILVSILSILGLILVFSLYLSVSNFGYTTMNAWIIHLSMIGGFTGISYFVYRYFYPDMFWPRYSVSTKKWNTTVDCRNYSDYEEGHYKGAIHWPLDTLNHQNIYDRLKELKSPVLVYDNTGKISAEWKAKFDLIAEEMGLKGVEIAFTDAHWKQIQKNKKDC